MALDTKKTLYLLVTCSLDKSRDILAKKTIKSLIKKSNNFLNESNFIIFDNNSKFKNHTEMVIGKSKILLSKKNIGFWNAINYVIKNYKKVLANNFKYIFIIESDIKFFDLYKLNEAENFLDENVDIGCIRTQEFSIKLKFLYDKKYSYLPFRKIRSLVSQTNPISNERIWFKKQKNYDHIYKTNFHAKLMCLHRIDSLKKIFNQLATKDSFSEIDFMNEYYRLYKINAAIDGGLYYTLGSGNKVETASHGEKEHLEAIGYENSRFGTLVNEYPKFYK